MHIRILDKYIFREVFKAFLFGICAFSAVFIGSGTLFKIAKYITDYGASLPAVIKIFIFGLPSVIMWTFPMSMLLATLLTFGRLSSSSEITAMKSCGIGFYRIAAPAVLMGLIVSIGAIAFNEYVVPWANTAYRNVLYYEIQGNNGMKSQEHIILKDIENGKIQRLVYARRYDGDTQTLQGVTMQDFNEEGKVRHVENAEYAEYSMDKWVMHNGMLYDISEGQSEHSMRFDTQVLPIKANPKQIVREQKDPEELTMKELRAQINIMKTQYVDTNKLEAEALSAHHGADGEPDFRAHRCATGPAADTQQFIGRLCDERYHHFLLLRADDDGQCPGAQRHAGAAYRRLDSEYCRTDSRRYPHTQGIPLIRGLSLREQKNIQERWQKQDVWCPSHCSLDHHWRSHRFYR